MTGSASQNATMTISFSDSKSINSAYYLNDNVLRSFGWRFSDAIIWCEVVMIRGRKSIWSFQWFDCTPKISASCLSVRHYRFTSSLCVNADWFGRMNYIVFAKWIKRFSLLRIIWITFKMTRLFLRVQTDTTDETVNLKRSFSSESPFSENLVFEVKWANGKQTKKRNIFVSCVSCAAIFFDCISCAVMMIRFYYNFTFCHSFIFT